MRAAPRSKNDCNIPRARAPLSPESILALGAPRITWKHIIIFLCGRSFLETGSLVIVSKNECFTAMFFEMQLRADESPSLVIISCCLRDFIESLDGRV